MRLTDAENRGLSMCDIDGTVTSAGSSDVSFTIQSVSKTIALLCPRRRLKSAAGASSRSSARLAAIRESTWAKRCSSPNPHSARSTGDWTGTCFTGDASITGPNPPRGDALALSSLSLAPEHVNQVVTLMATCGLYDGSGKYAFAVGLPSRSGVSGGIMGVVPGKLGIAAFCSAIDDKGASVVGRQIIEEISRAEGLSFFGGA